MRIRLALLAAVAAALLLSTAADARARAATYYLSLGDSLSVGVQPNSGGASVETGDGYANQLFARELPGHRGLRLVKLGCGGETTGSMIAGGKCQYRGDRRLGYSNVKKGSQLAAAERFLRRHRGHIAFVTVDIGANDVVSCAPNGQINGACLNAGMTAINQNIPKIARRLRAAAGRSTTIVGMTYYDPFLALYFESGTRSVALASVGVAKQVNDDITSAYRANGVHAVADVATAFETYDSTTQARYAGQTVPVNVAQVCTLTWMCAARPVGPNIHTNTVGYEVIAATFARLL